MDATFRKRIEDEIIRERIRMEVAATTEDKRRCQRRIADLKKMLETIGGVT